LLRRSARRCSRAVIRSALAVWRWLKALQFGLTRVLVVVLVRRAGDLVDQYCRWLVVIA
jgi:hypothetical protein